MRTESVAFVIPPSRRAPPLVRDLLHGCWCSGRRVGGIGFPPVTLAGFAGSVARKGFHPVLLDCPAERIPIENALFRLENASSIVVLSSFFSAKEDLSFFESLKRRGSRARLVLVGPFPTFQPELAAMSPAVDAIVRGEPDLALPDLFRLLEKPWSSPPPQGTSIRDGDGFTDFGEAGIVEDLNALPFPDRKLISRPHAYRNPAVCRTPFTTVFSSRGCASGCRFCPAPGFSQRQVRYRSVDSVIEEVREVTAMGYREIFFRDENFAGNRQRVLQLSERFSRLPKPVSWVCSSRADHLDAELLREMKRAGCHMVRIGVESGSQKVLDRNGKGIRLSRVVDVFSACRAIGVQTHAHMMFGMPGETEESLRESLAFIDRISPTMLTVGICTPIPGSLLFEELVSRVPAVGNLPASPEGIHTRAVLNQLYCDVSAEKLESAQRKVYRRFYGNPARWGSFLLEGIGSLGATRSRIWAAAHVLPFLARNRGKS